MILRFQTIDTPNDLGRALIKQFLLHAHAQGWVTQHGACRVAVLGHARQFWAGMLSTLLLAGESAFAKLLSEPLEMVDPVVAATRVHERLCAANREIALMKDLGGKSK